MQLQKTIFKIILLLIIFAGLGFFLSSKNISNFVIQKSGIAYNGNIDAGDYFLDLKCTRSSTLFGGSGKIAIEINSGSNNIGKYEKNINLGGVKKNTTESSTISLVNFSVKNKAEYQIKTNYEGDNGITSDCQIAFSKSAPFLGVKRDNWFFALISLVMIMVIIGVIFTIKIKLESSAELKRGLINLGEPKKIIKERLEWGRLLIYNVFFSIPLGIIFAVVLILVLKYILKIDDNTSANAAFWVFPVTFVLMIFGTYLKVVEYRFYGDKFFFHTFLLFHGGEIILYKNISSANINQKNKSIVLKYKDEYGEREEFEIKIEKETLNEDCRQISDLIFKNQNKQNYKSNSLKPKNMIDEKLKQLVKDFIKENSIDDGLRDYLKEKGYNFETAEEWYAMLRPIVREMGVPEDMIKTTIEDTFED